MNITMNANSALKILKENFLNLHPPMNAYYFIYCLPSKLTANIWDTVSKILFLPSDAKFTQCTLS